MHTRRFFKVLGLHERDEKLAHSELYLFFISIELSVDFFDYVIASGIFFLRKEDPMGHMEKVVSAMFQKSIKGIAFNSLSAWALEKTEREFYAEPQKVLEFCKKLSPHIILRHDYHPADFTVYVFKR